MSFLIAGAVAVGMAGTSAVLSARESAANRRRADAYGNTLKSIEENRQDISNPYANISNPFANLQVATGAANMAYEQEDLSLANTLDFLRETGSGAGGATALAQASLQSKKNISNSIEQQEARNAELRARGEAEREAALAQGEMFRFDAQENRENVALNRYAGLEQESNRLSSQYKQQMIDTIGSTGTNVAKAYAGYKTGL